MNKEEYLHAAEILAAAEGLDLWTAQMHVLLPKLREIGVPTKLLPALTSAERHWHGQPQDLMGARVETWEYLDSTYPQGTDLEAPAGRAARALLCVLDPGGDEDERDMTVEWFVAMADSGEIAS